MFEESRVQYFRRKRQEIVSVNSKNMNAWTKRLVVLKDQIHYWMDHTTEKTVEVIELFYDAIV